MFSSLSSRITAAFFASALVISVASYLIGTAHLRRVDAARAAVSAARAEAKAALRSAAKSDSSARRREIRADSSLRSALELAGKSNRAETAAAVARSAYRASPSPARVDTVLRADSVAIVTLRASRDSAVAAAVGFKTALDSTQAAYDVLRAATVNLDAAARDLSKAARPSLVRRILPRPFIGAVAGVDRLGSPNVTVGLGLGWAF